MSWGDAVGLVIILGGAVFLAAWAYAFMTDPRRRNPDLCEECGYDMRATPDRCPECGWSRVPANRTPGRIDPDRLLEDAPEEDVEPREPAADETEVVVYETDFAADADLLAEHLVARGVLCDVVEGTSSLQRGGRLDRDIYFQVVVWSGDRELAEDLIARVRVPEDPHPGRQPIEGEEGRCSRP